MYRSFALQNFRRHHQLLLRDCGGINLIAGPNGCGKTSLLEALFLHSGAHNPDLTLRVLVLRGVETFKVELGKGTQSPWEAIFSDFNLTKTIELTGRTEATGLRRLSIRVVDGVDELTRVGEFLMYSGDGFAASPFNAHVLQYENIEGDNAETHVRSYMVIDSRGIRVVPGVLPPSFPAVFLSARVRVSPQEEATRFSRCDLNGHLPLLCDCLRVFEPSLRRVSLLVVDGAPMLHGDVGLGRMVPLPFLGDGIVRFANLALALEDAQGGIVLVDELENGIHESIYPAALEALAMIAEEYQTQVFATTNSYSLANSAEKLFSGFNSHDYKTIELEGNEAA